MQQWQIDGSGEVLGPRDALQLSLRGQAATRCVIWSNLIESTSLEYTTFFFAIHYMHVGGSLVDPIAPKPAQSRRYRSTALQQPLGRRGRSAFISPLFR